MKTGIFAANRKCYISRSRSWIGKKLSNRFILISTSDNRGANHSKKSRTLFLKKKSTTKIKKSTKKQNIRKNQKSNQEIIKKMSVIKKSRTLFYEWKSKKSRTYGFYFHVVIYPSVMTIFGMKSPEVCWEIAKLLEHSESYLKYFQWSEGLLIPKPSENTILLLVNYYDLTKSGYYKKMGLYNIYHKKMVILG